MPEATQLLSDSLRPILPLPEPGAKEGTLDKQEDRSPSCAPGQHLTPSEPQCKMSLISKMGGASLSPAPPPTTVIGRVMLVVRAGEMAEVPV